MHIELDTIDTEVLLAELQTRFQSMLFGAYGVNTQTQDTYEYTVYTGNPRICQGLAYSIMATCEADREATHYGHTT